MKPFGMMPNRPGLPTGLPQMDLPLLLDMLGGPCGQEMAAGFHTGLRENEVLEGQANQYLGLQHYHQLCRDMSNNIPGYVFWQDQPPGNWNPQMPWEPVNVLLGTDQYLYH